MRLRAQFALILLSHNIIELCTVDVQCVYDSMKIVEKGNKKMKHNIKEITHAILFIVGFLMLFGLAGRGDVQVLQTEKCYELTQAQSCAK